MSVIVDASVGIQWVVRESTSDVAIALIDATPIVPGLFYAECANILWKKMRRKELSARTARDCIDALLTVHLTVLSDRELAADALRYACDLQHPAYDCIYIAAAMSHNAPLVTADKRLVAHCRAAKDLRLRRRVILLEDYVP